MKTKLLFIATFIAFVFSSTHAQVSFSSAGIAVQGIARDNTNTALTDRDISLNFIIYYKPVTGGDVTIYTDTKVLTTDAFGVFSCVLDPGSANNHIISNQQAYLRIKKDAITISDEKLNHVPYAISANNGVPTGSIMPFIGTTAPPGWVLCNGNPLPASATELIALIGNNAPNLQGMFLRGTGTSPVNSQAGPALKGTQADALKTHTATGATTSTGDHNHYYTQLAQTKIDEEDDNHNPNSWTGATSPVTLTTGGTGAHDHNVSVTYTGAGETRPVSFGVNYIIKL